MIDVNTKDDRLRTIVVGETATIREVMAAIDRGGCELGLVVGVDGRLVGTVTDGDVRRALLSGVSMEDPLGPHVQRKFTAVRGDSTRAEVLDLMKARVLQQIPVVDDDGRLVGLHLLREIIGPGERPNWAVIMAGGRGRRLQPFTDVLPKPMLPVAGRPILERIVLHLVGFGIRKFYISVHYKADLIERHFGSGEHFGCEIEYLREAEPLGTAGSLSLLEQRPEHPVVVLNGDLLTQVDVDAMLGFHASNGFSATIGVHQYTHTVPYGVVFTDGVRVSKLVEKPSENWLVNCGIYVLSPDILSRVPRHTETTMPELLETLFDRGEPVGAFVVEDEWHDLGRRVDLQRALGRESE